MPIAPHHHAGHLDGQADYRAALAGQAVALRQSHDGFVGVVAAAFWSYAGRLATRAAGIGRRISPYAAILGAVAPTGRRGLGE